MVTEGLGDKSSNSNSNSNSNAVERKEAEALLKRLEAQFGDVDLDLELLGLQQDSDENEESDDRMGLEDWEMVEKSVACNNSKHLTHHGVSSAPPAAATNNTSEDTALTHQQQLQPQVSNECGPVIDAEAAALMARLSAQFGDLDMSQLGLGVAGTPGGNGNIETNNDNNDSSDDESSLEEPTTEELAAWQAAHFSRGRELAKQKEKAAQQGQQLGEGNGTVVSIQQRRRILRDTTLERTASSSVLDLLGGDTSVFFGPSTIDILEELVSEKKDGDPEVLGVLSWKRLYASYEQGLGFWNLWKALKGYGGPTMMILRCQPSASNSLAGFQKLRGHGKEDGRTTTACLGFYTTTPWKESADLFGGDIADIENGDKAFLFSIDERGNANTKIQDEGNRKSRVQFFPVDRGTSASAPDGGRYMYCLPPLDLKEGTLSKNKTRAVVGLGVGGRPTQPRFHLTETLEDCSCLTYDSGRATRNGDLFACFDDTDGDQNTADGNAINTEVGSTTTSNTRCSPDEGHSFAQTLYCFDVTELEVWGIGGTDWIDHALQERERARQQHILRYQKVDKRMMWDQGVFGATSIGGSNNVRKSPVTETR